VLAFLEFCACRPGRHPDVVDLARTASPAVVRIRAAGTMVEATGAGFFIRGEDGGALVLTNNHLIWGAGSLTVQTRDGAMHPADVVGTDPEVDLAVLRPAGAESSPTLHFGNDQSLAIGDSLLSIGTPDGVFAAVSMGILSARAKVFPPTLAAESFVEYLFTDAAVSAGSSGGPLLDSTGAVVGISLAMLGARSALGIAIPVHLAEPIVKVLQRGLPFRHSFSGIHVSDGPLEGTEVGPRVFSCAADAALCMTAPHGGDVRIGDRIVAINGEEVRGAHEFEWRQFMAEPGTTWTLNIARSGHRLSTHVILQELTQGSFAQHRRSEKPE